MCQVKFIYNSQFIPIQCNSNDKMKEICQHFMAQIGENNINDFLFLYKGFKIDNYELTFSQQVTNFENEENNIMVILVYNTNDPIINQMLCKNSNQNNQSLNHEKLNNNEDVGIGLVFRTYDQENENNFFLISIQCKSNDKVSEVIKRYRTKANDQEPLKKFFYNAKELDPNKSIEESQLTNNSQIYVVTTKDVNGGK